MPKTPYHLLYQIVPGYMKLSEKDANSPEADPVCRLELLGEDPKPLTVNMPEKSIAAITVPIVYIEATQLEDMPTFRLEVTGTRGIDFHEVNEYKGKDTYARHDVFRKSVRVVLPGIPENAGNRPGSYEATFKCKHSVRLKARKWRGKDRKTEELLFKEKETYVKVVYRGGMEKQFPIDVDAGPHLIYFGAPIDFQYEVKVTEPEANWLMDMDLWSEWMRENYGWYANWEMRYGGRGDEI